MKQGGQYNYEIVKINHQTHVYSILEVVKGEISGGLRGVALQE
jgi:hypothetical protein